MTPNELAQLEIELQRLQERDKERRKKSQHPIEAQAERQQSAESWGRRFESAAVLPGKIAQQEAEPREIHLVISALDHAIGRLSKAVIDLIDRTSDVQQQVIEPVNPASCLNPAVPSAPLALRIAQLTVLLNEQTERLEALESCIQL